MSHAPAPALTVSHRLRPRARGQRGVLLLEVVLALAITATAGVATLGMISVTSLGARSAVDQTFATTLVTSQAEEIGAAVFVPTPGTYSSIPAPADWAVVNATTPFTGGDAAIQNVLITVMNGSEAVVSLEMVKVDR